MKRQTWFLLLISIPFFIQCDKIQGISYGSMDCSDAVRTTDVYSADSVTLSDGFHTPFIDDLGTAQITIHFVVSNACPADSVITEFTCHLAPGSPKEIYIGETVLNNLDEATGNLNIVSAKQENLYEVKGRGSYLAPARSSEKEFTVKVLFYLESSGNAYTDLAYFKRYFKDLTLRFTYSKLQ